MLHDIDRSKGFSSLSSLNIEEHNPAVCVCEVRNGPDKPISEFLSIISAWPLD